jgi:hypothetical protein
MAKEQEARKKRTGGVQKSLSEEAWCIRNQSNGTMSLDMAAIERGWSEQSAMWVVGVSGEEDAIQAEWAEWL